MIHEDKKRIRWYTCSTASDDQDKNALEEYDVVLSTNKYKVEDKFL